MFKKIIAVALFISQMACQDSIVNPDNSYEGIFQSFWEIMDERYVFFEEKNVDWDKVHKDWLPVFKEIKTDSAAVAAFDSIIRIVNDAHVWVRSNNGEMAEMFSDDRFFLVFWKIYKRYGFSKIREGVRYHTAQLPGSVAYLRVLPLLEVVNYNQLELEGYDYTNGLIIDLRDCTGGFETGYKICGIFYSGIKTLIYKQTKSGKAHNAFTKPEPLRLKGAGLVPDDIPLVVLINGNTYSMGHGIATIINDLTNCVIVGEPTSGGGGSIFEVFLPGEWSFSYTATRYINLSGQLTEKGLSPHVFIPVSRSFYDEVHSQTGEDPQLEKALEIIAAF